MTTLFGFPNLKGSVELIRFSFAIKLCFVVYLLKFNDDKIYIHTYTHTHTVGGFSWLIYLVPQPSAPDKN